MRPDSCNRYDIIGIRVYAMAAALHRAMKIAVMTASAVWSAGMAQAAEPQSGIATQTAERRQAFVLTAYSDAVGGASLIAGQYDSAIRELHQHSPGLALDAAVIATNRCVALSLLAQWEPAHAACNEALHAAKERHKNESIAVAYSNRAVMHWLVSEPQAAQEDLARARRLSPTADFVARNFAALRTRIGEAPVAVTQSRR